jgi:aldehyde:ferredoxin oxidoreductase
LDTGGYSFDQKDEEKNVKKAVEFLVRDEQGRVLLTSMVACLFARSVYTDELLANCLNSLGYTTLADNMQQVAEHIQKLRWRLRLATGFEPAAVKIPKRFTEITNWKGNIDVKFLNNLKKEYAKRIVELGKVEEKKAES